MGEKGKLARIVNPILTPVTHPLLPNASAPGQLSVKQIHQCLSEIGDLPAKKFYVVGEPISHSRSPALHNTGYKELGLPHEMFRFETSDAAKIHKELLSDPNFGGAAITIPLKIDMLKYVDELSNSGKVIGAINTIYPIGKGKFAGTNTDWLGIVNSFIRNSAPAKISSGNGLIIGGGGTSRAALYALHSMGCKKIYMLNRTASKLLDIKKDFPASYNVEVLESLEQIETVADVKLAVSTVPGNLEIDSGLLTKIKAVLAKGGKESFLIEAAYKPLVTAVMKLAKDEFHWNVIPGREMLVNQGVVQFGLFTGFDAPYKPIYDAVVSDN
ncbi:unnamed protein product [Ambrosiozyma monospora]|uniref:Unnamed protein product n=1 Tax=Ambrosiozyma monospora TaxID=43982 RepID=A0ACB5SZT7_AMBMO|nr:unnamed protein product [Ambrosiozyma monospora]